MLQEGHNMTQKNPTHMVFSPMSTNFVHSKVLGVCISQRKIQKPFPIFKGWWKTMCALLFKQNREFPGPKTSNHGLMINKNKWLITIYHQLASHFDYKELLTSKKRQLRYLPPKKTAASVSKWTTKGAAPNISFPRSQGSIMNTC